MLDTDDIEALFASRSDDAAEWRILRAILEWPGPCCPLVMALRVAGMSAGIADGGKAVMSLTAAGWIRTWQLPIEERPLNWEDSVTLTSWAADALGVMLAEPAQEGPDVEPRWGRLDQGFYDEFGRHPDEPDHFLIETMWGKLKRSKQEAEKILAARSSYTKPKPPGKSTRKRQDKGKKKNVA